jgi:hypothetical protein
VYWTVVKRPASKVTGGKTFLATKSGHFRFAGRYILFVNKGKVI